jgi:hypothetical protein
VRATNALLVAAGVWAAGLPVAASLLPAYSRGSGVVSGTSAGIRAHAASTARQTLLQVNGEWVVVVLCLPLLAVGLVALALWQRRCGRAGAGRVAWAVTGALGVASLVAILTVGLFVAPVFLLLAGACAGDPSAERTGVLWRTRG